MLTKYKAMKRNTNNVLLFPQEAIKYPDRVGNMDEIELNLQVANHLHVTHTLETVIPILLTKLEEMGFIVGVEDDKKDGALLYEAMRSLLLKHFSIDHPFQRLSNKIFVENENGGLEVADIKLGFKK